MPVCYRHPDRESYIRCTRCDRPICPDDMVPASVGFHCPDDAREGARSVREARTTFGGRLRSGPPRVTLVLIALNVLVFLGTLITTAPGRGVSLAFGGGDSPVYRLLAMQPVALQDGAFGVVLGVADGQYYRLLTATFVHFGLTHILLNMLALLAIGPQLEAALGRVRYLALYLLAGIGGTVASYAFGPTNVRAAGASGAIFGLFAAAYLVERRRRSGAASQYAVLLAINLAITIFVPFIDLRGHLGGLVVGAAATAVLVLAPRVQRDLVQAVGLALLAFLLVALTVLRTAALGA